MKTFAEFQEAIQSEALQKELSAFLAEKKPVDKEAEILAVAEFAAGRDYAVTAEELCAEIASKRELSDEEAENVAGTSGIWCWSNYDCVFSSASCVIGAH